MGAIEKMGHDFLQGFKDGQRQAENNPKFMLVAIIVAVVFAALYFIQKWTGIPVLNWTTSALEWIWGLIWGLIKKLLDLL